MPILTAARHIEPWRRRLFLPAYSVAEAARYAGTPPQTVSYWHYGGGNLGPALPGSEQRKPLSYLELAEVAFVATFRLLGVSLQRIRRARQYAAQIFDSEYPFAEQRWLTEGHHVLLDLRQIEDAAEMGRLVVADSHGQMAWQALVSERFAQFDYEHGLALIWHVAGRQSPVIIDPRIAFGAPTVKGIATWILKGRWQAGEAIEDIQDDFGIDENAIKHGLAFEGIGVGA